MKSHLTIILKTKKRLKLKRLKKKIYTQIIIIIIIKKIEKCLKSLNRMENLGVN